MKTPLFVESPMNATTCFHSIHSTKIQRNIENLVEKRETKPMKAKNNNDRYVMISRPAQLTGKFFHSLNAKTGEVFPYLTDPLFMPRNFCAPSFNSKICEDIAAPRNCGEIACRVGGDGYGPELKNRLLIFLA